MPITAKGHKMLAAFHGLNPETNDDNDVAEAIKKGVTSKQVDDLKNRADKAEAALVEQDLVRFANRIGAADKVKAHWKKALIANRTEAIEMLEAMPEPTPTKDTKREPLHVKNRAGQPNPVEETDDKKLAEETKKAKTVANRARQIQREKKISYRAAFAIAEQESA